MTIAIDRVNSETMNTMKSISSFFLLILLTLLMTGCNTTSADTGDIADRQVNVIATTGMIADVVRNVGGDRVSVIQMMGAGVDPHLYRASEGDVQRLQEADIIFYNGLHLESKMGEVLEQLDGVGKSTIAVAEVIPAEQLLSPPEFQGFNDPHVWMDAKLWRYTVDAIRDGLIAIDPQHADNYRANADAYRAEMDALEAYAQEQFAQLSDEQRVLVTAHDAFNYFAIGYDFRVFAPQGISTETEAGVEDIRATIDFMVENNVPAIFVESTISPDIVEAVVEGARARGHDVTIGGELFTDAMGADGTPEGTYLGMIRHNVDTIVAALKQ
jgi:manganese/zinc/iron transport system substrate-binding protein